jgi:hypothetical protein
MRTKSVSVWGLATLIAVHWTELADISDGNRIHRHNRLFTNWHREREQFIAAREKVVLHRISPKRVVLEIKSQTRKRRGLSLSSLAGLLAVFGALAFLMLQPADAPEAKEAAKTALPSPTVEACAAIRNAKGQLVPNLSNFQVENWTVETYGASKSIGSLVSVSFEATCRDKLLVGQLVANQTEAGLLILQMAPIS